MRCRAPAATLVLLGPLLAPSAALAAKTDVVVLSNGDHLTGEVKDLERGRLTFKTDDMGTLAIEWDNIRSIAATAPFEIDDLDGRRYVGSLEPGSVAGELRLVGSDGAYALELRRVARLRRLGTTFWQRLDGSMDLGASYASASELFKLDFAAAFGLDGAGHRVALSASSTLSSQPGMEDTRRNNLALSYERRFQSRWVALLQGQLEQNRELGFDLRTSASGGGGRYLAQSQRDRLLVGLGFSLNREWPVEGGQTTNVEATALVRYDRFSYDFPHVDVSLVVAGFTSLTDGGRHRLEADAQLKREVVKDFYVTLRGYESYDSRPATEGAKTNDYGFAFALGWSF